MVNIYQLNIEGVSFGGLNIYIGNSRDYEAKLNLSDDSCVIIKAKFSASFLFYLTFIGQTILRNESKPAVNTD